MYHFYMYSFCTFLIYICPLKSCVFYLGAYSMFLNSNILNMDLNVCCTIWVCDRMRLASSDVTLLLRLLRDSAVDRRRDWLLVRDVVDSRRFLAPLQLLGMLKAQRLW